MLHFRSAFDPSRIAYQEITFLFEKVVAENSEGLCNLPAGIAPAPQILDRIHLYVASESDFRYELHNVRGSDIQMIHSDDSLYDLFEFGIFHDETNEVME